MTISEFKNIQTVSDISPQSVMLQLVHSNWVFQIIYAAAKLGIADLLKDGALSCDQLASATGTHARSLYRLMRALASINIFAENEQSDFTLTPLGACLLSDVPGSIRAAAIMLGEEHYRVWGDILYSVRTGTSAFKHLYDTNVFQYYAQNPEPAKIFSEAMTSVSTIEDAAIVEGYDFAKIQKLVDVGGGHGSLLISILKSNPHLRGVLFDQPFVIEGAKHLFEQQGVSSRCEFVSGNFFQSVPTGGDAYILKHVVHDWNDEKAITILKQCHQAMVENNLLLLVEMVIPPGNSAFMGKLVDVNMLLMCDGGCERTESEYQSLLKSAGFQLTNIFYTQSNASVIEAIRL